MEQWNKEDRIAVLAWGLARSAFCSGPFRVEQALQMWNQHPSVLRLHKRISPMATSASQTYISKLGFQDRDRSNERHGLACEYLFERMLELEVAPRHLADCRSAIEWDIRNAMALIAEYERNRYRESEAKQEKAKLQDLEQQLATFDANAKLSDYIAKTHNSWKVGSCVNVPITSRSYVNGFADVLISANTCTQKNQYYIRYPGALGEVKITKEPAENVLQQINFYLNYLEVETVYILTDYDPGDLKRLCAGTKIKVYRLGQVFEQWLAGRTTPETEEL